MGGTGWVMYTVVKAAATRPKTRAWKVKKDCRFIAFRWSEGGHETPLPKPGSRHGANLAATLNFYYTLLPQKG